jgi:Bacterial CdiA-CT RNAse A domain
MPHPDDSYLRHQWQRWTRHDAHLWIRPDVARFLPPGMDPAEVYPTLARKPDAAKAAAFEAEIAAGYRLLAVLREEMASLRAELKRRRELEAKYSPSQPRVPSGNPRGGQWTDRSGGQGTVAGPSQDTGQSQDADLILPMGNVDVGDLTGSTELGDLFRIKPDQTRVIGEQVAGERQGGYPVDLLEERERGGHAIEGHIRSDQSLKSDLEARVAEAVRNGDSVSDMRQGSFSSLESANKLVNATIARNSEQVSRVVNGESPKENLDKDFPTPTGREAVARTERSQIYIQDTSSVRVVIVPDSTAAKGYRVETAFPTNRRR